VAVGEAVNPYYQDDLVTLYHADCREMLPLEADVIVTDPPYGMAAKRTHGGSFHGVTIAGDHDQTLRDEVLASWSGPALVFGSWKVPPPAGVREVLVWDKVISTGMGDLAIPWRPSWEAIYVIGGRFVGPRSHGVLRYGIPTLAPERKRHPTPKPVDLMRDLIQKTEGRVIDPFAGSGSTLVAAKSLGRKAIGIEIEERYCEVAAQRCSQEVLGLESA
jgi:DNA modification methylase